MWFLMRALKAHVNGDGRALRRLLRQHIDTLQITVSRPEAKEAVNTLMCDLSQIHFLHSGLLMDFRK